MVGLCFNFWVWGWVIIDYSDLGIDLDQVVLGISIWG